MSDSPDVTSGPQTRHLTVDENSVGQRLDNYLVREMRGVPRSRLHRALRKGEVRVNKGRVRADYRLVEGDVVRLPPLRQATLVEQAAIPQRRFNELSRRVVHEDDSLLTSVLLFPFLLEIFICKCTCKQSYFSLQRLIVFCRLRFCFVVWLHSPSAIP